MEKEKLIKLFKSWVCNDKSIRNFITNSDSNSIRHYLDQKYSITIGFYKNDDTKHYISRTIEKGNGCSTPAMAAIPPSFTQNDKLDLSNEEYTELVQLYYEKYKILKLKETENLFKDFPTE